MTKEELEYYKKIRNNFSDDIDRRSESFFGINDANYDVFDEEKSRLMQYGYNIGCHEQHTIDVNFFADYLVNNYKNIVGTNKEEIKNTLIETYYKSLCASEIVK